MKLQIDHQRNYPMRSGEAMAQAPEEEISEDLTKVKEKLVKVKEEFEHWLTVKSSPNTEYHLTYARAVIGLRILFPKEPELTQISQSVQEKLTRLLTVVDGPSLDFKHSLGAGWTVDNLLMHNPLAMQKLFGPDKHENPRAIEYLYRFASARQKRNFLMMVELGLVCHQLYPETTDQVRQVVEACWSDIIKQPPLEDITGWLELVAKGLLVHPGLRDKMDVHSSFFEDIKRQALREHSADWLMWLKVIQAEDARLNEKHELVITPQRHIGEAKTIPLPPRTAI